MKLDFGKEKIKSTVQLSKTQLSDTSFIEKLLHSKEEIIKYLKKELKNQQDYLKNQVDSLIKEKEEMQLELHRKTIEDKEAGNTRSKIPIPLAERQPNREEPEQPWNNQNQNINTESVKDMRRTIVEIKAEMTKLENENFSLHALHKRDAEKTKQLDEIVSRLNEEISSTKQDLMQIFNIIFERNDLQLLEKVERIINYHRSFV